MWSRSRGRSTPSGLAGDDRAVAAAVGAVLLLAVLVTVYGAALQSEVPRVGAEAERAWDREMERALLDLASSFAGAVDEGLAAEGSLPGPPEVAPVSFPLLPPVRPASPGGSVQFDPRCAGFTATHVTASEGVVVDLASAATGCLRFKPAGTYGPLPEYVLELGGLLRVERGEGGPRAVVLQGPLLTLNESQGGTFRVGIVLPGMGGPAHATVLDEGDSLRVEAVVVGRALDEGPDANAEEATWRFHTRFPEAWRDWLEGALAASGVPAGAAQVRCLMAAGGPNPSCGAAADGSLTVVELHALGRAARGSDLAVSVSHTLFEVRLR